MTDGTSRPVFLLRPPADVLEVAVALARRENRSINRQLVTLLQEALAARQARQDTPAGDTRAG